MRRAFHPLGRDSLLTVVSRLLLAFSIAVLLFLPSVRPCAANVLRLAQVEISDYPGPPPPGGGNDGDPDEPYWRPKEDVPEPVISDQGALGMQRRPGEFAPDGAVTAAPAEREAARLFLARIWLLYHWTR